MHIVCFSGITWEQRKLDDFGLATSGTSIESEFSSDGKYKVISIGSYSENSVYTDQGIRAIESEKTIKRVLNEDDLTMILNDKTTSGNIIGRVLRIEKGGIYVYNQRTQRIEPNKEKYDTQFLYQLLNAPLIREKIFKQSQGNTQIYVNWSAIKELDYLIPSLSEQKQIGVYFQNIDNLITLHQRKLEKIKAMKAAYLTEMFPQEGENVPKRRFAGFTDAWEQRKFGDLVQRLSNTAISNEEIPCVEYEDVISEHGLLNKNINKKEVTKTGILFTEEDILYGKLRPYLHNWLNPDFKGVAVGDWWVLNPNNANKHFVYRLIQTQQYDDVANQSTGTKMPRADWNLVSNTDFKIPSNLEEQRKIGEYFTNLDNLITLHQRKLDKLQNIKKAYLNEMFI